MAKTYTQSLEEVQAAITAITSGAQSHSIKDRTFTLADLETLFEMEKHYMPLAAAESRGGSGIRSRMVTPVG